MGGTGLGLSISEQLSHLLGGEIGVSSTLNEGSMFWFTMCLDVDSSATTKHIHVDKAHFEGIKALIVDDTDVAIVISKEQLGDTDIDISEASSAKQALEKIEKAAALGQPYDVVITDLCMPEVNGIELGKQILEDESIPKPSIILLTSAPRKEDEEKIDKLGFAGYLIKPAFKEDLLMMLNVICNARKDGKDLPLLSKHSMSENYSMLEPKTMQQTNFSSKRILLTEDNETNLFVAKTILEKMGCIVTTARNGKIALDIFKNAKFDCILMDCQMPEMDGFEATTLIRQHEEAHQLNKTPIIALTANAMIGDRERCLDAGMDDYLAKPIQPKPLKQVLGAWI